MSHVLYKSSVYILYTECWVISHVHYCIYCFHIILSRNYSSTNFSFRKRQQFHQFIQMNIKNELSPDSLLGLIGDKFQQARAYKKNAEYLKSISSLEYWRKIDWSGRDDSGRFGNENGKVSNSISGNNKPFPIKS